MHTELTNLLPPERIRGLSREYFLRLATVLVFALVAIVLGSGALLVPSYLYLTQAIQTRESQGNDLDAQLASSGGQETNQRLSALNDNATYLARLASSTPATDALRGVLLVPRVGVTLTGFTFTPAVHGNDGKMILTGTASTRETLRSYGQALGALPFVSSIDLPISSYAKDSDIPFTITLTGSLKP